jgi:anti-sigma factor RsiW
VTEGAVSELDLHAYIDGELPPDRMAEVEAAMASDRALAERVNGFRADKQALIAAYRSLSDAPVPAALLKAAWAGAPQPRAVIRPRYIALGAMAALAACLALVVVPRNGREPAVEQAIAARDNARTPSRQLDGSSQAGLDTASRAMSDMLGNPVRVPDLSRAGFTLVAADLYGQPRSDAVQLRYQDAARRLFTVYLRPSAGSDAFEVTERGPVRICVWQNADLTAVMTGAMPAPELFRLASMTYTSLGL